MPRKPTKEKPAAKRSSKAGVKVDKVVESSIVSNHRPRQPKIRPAPPKRTAPVAPVEKRKPGRPPGSKSKTGAPITAVQAETNKRALRARIQEEAVVEARATGLLPHEWMLAVMRGEQINHFAYDADTQEIIEVIVLPTFADRMEMAKAAAPFYSTKMPTPKGGVGSPGDPARQRGVMEVPMVDSMQKWAEVATESQRLLKKEVTQ